MQSKLPPHNEDAEEAVIGSLLIAGEDADCASTGLVPTDFYYEVNQWMFEACQSLNQRGVTINQITLAQELAQRKKLEVCGGAAQMSHLISICPTHLDLPYYADIVRRLSTYRRMINLSETIAAIGYEAAPDLPASIARADDLLLDLRKKNAQSTVINPEERLSLLVDRYTELYKSDGGVAIPTGLADLDKELGGGLYDGDLVVIAGRASMGKTALMQSVMNHVSTTKPILFASAEMSTQAIGDRDVAGLLGVKIQKVRLGGYDADMFGEMTGPVMDILAKRKIHTCDDNPLTTAKIIQAAVATQLRYGLGAVFIDYLGALADDGENQVTRLGNMTRALKGLARKLNVPVVVAHQLNRNVEQREVKDKRPQLSDLRESGHVEEDADVVLMLYRDSYYKLLQGSERLFLAKFGDGEVDWEQAPESLRDFFVSEVIIRKHRQGESNVAVKVWFDRKHQTYCNLAKEL